jgi:2-keto-4-pentenoate hydratase/2-oxohepta-3-ene-1,7-dioic acid hydratase in catechol pathway
MGLDGFEKENSDVKLLRFGEPGRERPGLLHSDGSIRDLSGIVGDIDGASLSPAGLDALSRIDVHKLPVVPSGTRIGPCVGRVGKIVCVGRNYAEHVKETAHVRAQDATLPSEPVLFMKATTSIVGPDDDVMLPLDSVKTDWEIELAAVIGTRARYVEESEALTYVAGYTIINDVSEREFQLERGGQWDKGKSCDTFAPLGPWVVTRDEIPDIDALELKLAVNGTVRQHSSTAHMIFKLPTIISYISRFMTLLPGDVIATGTPSGVGLGLKPPVFLKAGDEMELTVERLGRQRQRVIGFSR